MIFYYYFECLIFATISAFIQHIILNPLLAIIRFFASLDRSCGWYTRNKIRPWQLEKAKTLFAKQQEANRKKEQL